MHRDEQSDFGQQQFPDPGFFTDALYGVDHRALSTYAKGRHQSFVTYGIIYSLQVPQWRTHGVTVGILTRF